VGGLKTLSKQAYDILYHSQPLTYREVAQRVIENSGHNHEKNSNVILSNLAQEGRQKHQTPYL
jgi:hypothetical protein